MSKKVVYETTQPVSALVPMSVREVVRTIVTGVVVGLVVIAIYLLLNKYLFGAVLCRPQSPSECGQAPTYAIVAAQVIGIIVGLGALARLRIYRPLFVVIATVITLWTLQLLISPLPWFGALLAGAVLFGLSYGLYAWIARIRSFILAAVIAIVLIVLVRIAFM